ncbi:GRIP and coiled-coil domain-containing protein 1-like [Sinocyclocheilus rhinocerous]|uniref:GRIP and coiled-coil domain-containing protein 1 n=1 Tax=Sinocyclocheilus rhinocerous TaxID=307959 RepID=A0A673M3N5_9TELE|nr:PREDICTED: GRIP and coiled-coil domain-containing protein 1-like [Sinocyclocheilus rhinocerous]XP_016406159.1 PREDICTED: GRIP and coiled-coil domain-containing protein 1-like [Sinocyclocheilus rhinocerous]
MEKFGMSFGGGPGKKELLETIEVQKKQLVKYQTRFKDVVRAYQSLLKEKEALEASLKVLTISQEVDLSQCGHNLSFGVGTENAERPLPSDLGDDRSSLHSEDSLDTAASAETATSVTSNSTKGDQIEEDQSCAVDGATAGTVANALPQQSEEASGSESGISSSSSSGCTEPPPPAADTDRRIIQLKMQLSTLTSSLATVTQEKSRMEASFQADKRKMKQELEELQARMEEEQKQHQLEHQSLLEQLAESKARVITQQHEREQEQGDHVLMLRELQKLLQEERGLRQDAELKLEDSREALAEAMQVADRGIDYETQLKEITQEREELRKSLKAAAAEKSKPDPRVEELQQEIAELKAHFNQQLQQEIRKVAQTDERLREQAQMEEARVASLEERVSELSELLGACEKARQKDQQNAQRLRERILQLDTENKTLAIKAVNRSTTSDLNLDDTNLNVDVLKDKLDKVKKLLLLAAQRSQDQSLDIERLLEGEKNQEVSESEKASVLHYQQELRQLREEFERYKMRVQGVLKNKNMKDGNQAKELEEARDQLAELKEKYINLRIISDEAEVQHKRDLEERQQALVVLQQTHKQEVERLEAQHRENFLRLEEELHKQRDRTMALLAEKDLELERLRAATVIGFGSHQKHATNNSTAMEGGDPEEADPELEESDIIAQALKLAGPNEPTLLLYAEQLARKEVEVAALRKQKHRLEEDLHQLQGKLIANGERHEEEVAELRCQLDKRIRDQGRDGANLEYLKNVIYRFLTLHDTRGRQQTLTAILTILHFSPQEKQAVLKQQQHSWWMAGMR